VQDRDRIRRKWQRQQILCFLKLHHLLLLDIWRRDTMLKLTEIPELSARRQVVYMRDDGPAVPRGGVRPAPRLIFISS
jgi:hypothetical protein